MCASGYLTYIINRIICVLAGCRYLQIILMKDDCEATGMMCVLTGKNSVVKTRKCALAGNHPNE